MLEIYLVRHGQTVWNSEHRVQGQKNSQLTDLGIQQAKKLSKQMENIEWGTVYSSPLQRAYETARFITKNSVEIVLNEDFQEMDFGEWEGKQFLDIQKAYPEQFNNFDHCFEQLHPEGGEAFTSLKRRVEKGLARITKQHNNEKILIVSHTITIKTALCSYYEGEDKRAFWASLRERISPCSISVLTCNNNDIKIKDTGLKSLY